MEKEQPREDSPARLWRKRNAIALWGGSLLLCALAWRMALIYVAQQPLGWVSLALLPPFLLLAAWLHFYLVAGDGNYRDLIAAGKIATPEEAGRIDAVKLKNPKRGWYTERKWKGLWPAHPLLGHLLLAGIMSLLVLGASKTLGVPPSDWVGDMDPAAQHRELSAHVAPAFAAALLAAVTSRQVLKRRHKRIWAEIRASRTDKR